MPTQITYYNKHLLPNPEAICIYNHIPKCGGSTLRKMLEKCYPSIYSLQNYSILNYPKNKNIDCYVGHNVVGIESYITKENYFYITFLRHPFSLFLSLYTFNKNFLPQGEVGKKTLEEHLYTNNRKNILIDLLGHGDKYLAEDNLFEKYAFFGLQEYFTDSIFALSELIPSFSDLPIISRNVSTSKETVISEQAKDYFYEYSKDDMELYEKAKKEFLNRYPIKTSISQPTEAIEISTTSSTTNTSTTIHTKKNREHEAVELWSCVLNNETLLAKNNSNLEENIIRVNSYISTKEEITTFFHYLMQYTTTHPIVLQFAFNSANRANLKEIKVIAQQLFILYSEYDSQNTFVELIRARLNLIKALARKGLWAPKEEFDASLEKYLITLQLDNSWKAESLYIQALLYSSINNFTKAIILLKEAVLLSPQNLEMRNDLLKMKIKNSKDILEQCEKEAMKELKCNPKEEWAARQLAIILAEKNQKQKAIEAAKKSLVKNPYWNEGKNIIQRCNNAPSKANPPIKKITQEEKDKKKIKKITDYTIANMQLQLSLKEIFIKNSFENQLGALIIKNCKSVKGLLLLPFILLQKKLSWLNTPPKELGDKNFNTLIKLYEDKKLTAVRNLLSEYGNKGISPIVLANAYAAVAKHVSSQNLNTSIELQLLAYKSNPSSYHLKWLAFYYSDSGNNSTAQAIIDILPLDDVQTEFEKGKISIIKKQVTKPAQ